MQDYKDEWELLDRTLYRLCKKFPDHNSASSIHAKLWLVGRSYATGIERQMPKGVEAMRHLANHFKGKANRQVNDLFARLHANVTRGLLNSQNLSTIVKLHSELVDLVKPITRDGRQRVQVFASKYMHFHNEAVPIYDGWAVWNLGKYVDGGNPRANYPDFAIRFHKLYQHIQSMKLPLKVKYVDHYLMSLP